MAEAEKVVKVTEDPKTTNEVKPVANVQKIEAPVGEVKDDAAIVAEAQAAEKAAFEAEEAEAAKLPTPAQNAGSDIAAAITQGLKGATEKNFTLQPDTGVEPRFSVVKNKQGEVMVRENENGVLSKVQLESIEEKEASIQGQEVEEV